MSDKIKNAPPMTKKGNIGRVIKKLVGYYPVLAPLTALCILFSAIVSSIPSIFMQNVLSIVEKYYKLGDWSTAKAEIMPWVTALIVLYVLSILSMTLYSQLMAYMTQGFLNKLRREMFDGMQDLPIKYFDTHQHGDIMSYYTNDIDTLRQLVSQAIPSFIQAGAIVLCVLAIMLYYSILMTLVLLLGVVAMIFVAKKVGGGSARFFLRQQKSVAKTEGYIQEMMNGQKVVKVFCHEDACLAGFDEINDALCNDSFRANAYANILGPIIGNIGNVLYVTLALVGGVFLLANIPNVSISGAAFSVSILVPFLNMSKQFTGNVNQLSQQINAIVMAGAGAERIFTLIEEKPETTAMSPSSTRTSRLTARSQRAPSAPDTGRGGIRTATAASPIPSCAATCAWWMSISATRRARRFCTTCRFTPSRGRRSPSSARPAQARPRSRTSSTASTTLPTERYATTA